MNKWVLLTLIFLIILTGIVFSIDTSRDKVVSFTNQALRVVNSREFLNSDVKIENTNPETQKQTVEITTTKVDTTNTQTKLSNQDLMDLKFNELLNKKTEVKSIWDRKEPTKVKVNNQKAEQNSTKITTQKNEITQQTQKAENKTNTTQPTVKIEPVKTITKTETKATTKTTPTQAEPTTVQTIEKVAKLPAE